MNVLSSVCVRNNVYQYTVYTVSTLQQFMICTVYYNSMCTTAATTSIAATTKTVTTSSITTSIDTATTVIPSFHFTGKCNMGCGLMNHWMLLKLNEN